MNEQECKDIYEGIIKMLKLSKEKTPAEGPCIFDDLDDVIENIESELDDIKEIVKYYRGFKKPKEKKEVYYFGAFMNSKEYEQLITFFETNKMDHKIVAQRDLNEGIE